MLELPSANDPFMAVRILDYDGGLYRQLQRTLDLGSGDLLPIVLPVVFHTGHRTWTAKREVFDLITSAPPEVEPYLPHLRYLLLDAHAFAPAQLAAMRNPVACNLWLEASEVFVTRPTVRPTALTVESYPDGAAFSALNLRRSPVPLELIPKGAGRCLRRPPPGLDPSREALADLEEFSAP